MSKLVFFTSLPRVGGHTTISLGLVRLLRTSFDQISVIVREMAGHGTSSDALSELSELGVTVLQLPGQSTGSDFRKLIPFVVRHRKPDVFLAMGMRHFSPVLAVMLMPKRSVYYHITHELTPTVVQMLRWYSSCFSKLAFISPATEHQYAEHSNGRGITLAITQPIGANSGNRVPHSREGAIRYGFIGRLNKDKGCEVLRQFGETCSIPCTVRIAGAGDYEQTFRQLSATKSSAVQYQFDGAFDSARRSEYLSDFFSSIDYLVVPSQDDREGLPTVILESLQAGVPVLATRTGGMRAFDLPDFGRKPCVTLVEKEEFANLMKQSATQPRPAIDRECVEYFDRMFSDNTLRDQWNDALALGPRTF